MTERTVKRVMEDLAATGLTPEQQALVGELILSASRYSVHHHYGKDETPAAGRMRAMRERNKAVTSVTESGDGVLLDNSIKEDIKNNNTPPTPRILLKTILDDERTDAVLEHRRKLRKPLTCRAAKLLASEFSKAPDPNAAADLMLARGWTGFEVEWLKGKPPPNLKTINGGKVPLKFKPEPPKLSDDEWVRLKAERNQG